MEHYIVVVTYFDNTIDKFDYIGKSGREFALTSFEASKKSPAVNAMILLHVTDDDVEVLGIFERERDER